MRVSKTLKNRLQASLESLTPLEAGRLYAIYVAEARKKKVDVKDYAPMKELWAALDARVAKARGKPDEATAVDEYNAVVFLSELHAAINNEAKEVGITLAWAASEANSRIAMLFMHDAAAEVARQARRFLVDSFPRPIDPEDYDSVMAWATTDALFALDEAAWSIVGYDNGSEGDFKVVFDQLVAKLKTGDLVGGEALTVADLDGPVMVETGTFPAWAALQLTWRPYVTRRGLRVYLQRDSVDEIPVVVDRITDGDDKRLDAAALRKLAGEFYKDVRRRPWGKGLVADPGDLDQLVAFLLQHTNALLRLKAPDWGRVDWKAFAKAEVDPDGEPYQLAPAATVGSLDALDEGLRRGETFSLVDYQREQYYPASRADDVRRMASVVFALLDALDTTGQTFTYDRREEGMLTLSEFMGIKFATPLEQAIEKLRLVSSYALSLREALNQVVDRYFDGLDILDPESEDPILRAEAHIQEATTTLSDWRAKLKAWPWEITADSLDPGQPEADDDDVRRVFDRIVEEARLSSRVKNADNVLFPKQGRLL